jgi:hypothetical protein
VESSFPNHWLVLHNLAIPEKALIDFGFLPELNLLTVLMDAEVSVMI